ncbi:MAG: RNA polymerase sigma-54 factor [Treponema sp.]|nr:RNA polymerase sigma-54 factor [Treponema sp.]
MADSAGFTAAPHLQMRTHTEQRQKQTQVQRLSQQQIMSLKLLAMSSLDLRESIYSEAERNPALEITEDRLMQGATTVREHSSAFSDNGRYSAVSAAGEAASDAFQAALENSEDYRESLQDHLLHQYNAINHSYDEQELGTALIYNLDASGFHILAPLSLLNKKRPAQNEALLKKCMDEIRALDPAGTCCSGVEESLLVQAHLCRNAPRAALFLLDGHLPLLDPPQSAKILKKIQQFLKERQSLAFTSQAEQEALLQVEKKPFTEAEIDEALAFIRTLDPYPARNFGSAQAQYIAPDVYVERLTLTEENEKNGIVNAAATSQSGSSFKITLAGNTVPRLSVAADFEKAAETKSGGKVVQDAVREARIFIDSVKFRESTLARAAAEIVRAQAAFFEHGARYLAPLRQKDIAEKLGVHEATISRMANGKYLQCEWGLFAFSYFFTNAVATTPAKDAAWKAAQAEPTGTDLPLATAAGSPNGAGSAQGVMSAGAPVPVQGVMSAGAPVPVQGVTAGSAAGTASGIAPGAALPVSKEGAKYEIAEILKEHAGDAKPLSDQKIAGILAERGIQIARRTVAKYRSELNVASSFAR